MTTTTTTRADAERAAQRMTQRTRVDVARATGRTQDEGEIHVTGTPAPQGSKRAYIIPAKGKRKARVNLVESSAAVKPWRAAVVAAWGAAGHGMVLGPVAVSVEFHMPRPRSHYRTGRYSALMREDAPLWPATPPDLDKLLRSTLDGLTTAGAIEDDSRVVILHGTKMYADAREPGALIRVRSMDALMADEAEHDGAAA